MEKNISPNITYAEATYSLKAKELGLDNTPSKEVLENMQYVAEGIFEPVRNHFNKPIFVSSFYRSPKLNVKIGGSTTSQHSQGLALDMDGDIYGSPSNKEIFEYIKKNLVFDQLIVEGIVNGKIAWIHASLKKTGNRKQILFMYKNSEGKTIYENYSDKRYKELVK